MIIPVILFSVVDFFVSQIVARFLVNWWAPLFACDGEVLDRGVATKGPRLPNWLAWFDTFDGTLDAGLQPGEKSTYWTRWRWLNRNSAYGFSYWVLGVKFVPVLWRVDNPSPTDFKATGPDGLFNRNVVAFGIQWKFGWKAKNYFDRDGCYPWSNKPWGPEMRVPFVFSLSLAKK